MVSDDFNRTDSTDLGANWTDLTGGMRVISNEARGENDAVYNWAVWTANTWNANQSSQVTVSTNFADCGVILRAVSTGGGTGYMAMAHQTLGMRIYRRDSGSFTLLQDIGGSVSAGDTIKLEITGTTLKYYKNGVQQGTDQDATASGGEITGGSAGIYVVGTTAQEGVDDWIGTGEVVAGGPITWDVKPDSNAPYSVWGLKP